MTNANKIRTLTDENLAKFLVELYNILRDTRFKIDEESMLCFLKQYDFQLYSR